MCVEGGFFFKINKRASTFIREMRVAGVIPEYDTQWSETWNTKLGENCENVQCPDLI